MMGKFAVFILSHGRADNVRTVKTLIDGGYSGEYYIIIDNEDEQAQEYIRRYGDKVIVFDKLAISRRVDTADIMMDRRGVVFARNASFDIAKQLGLDIFLQLDDDYTCFSYRTVRQRQLKQYRAKQLDRLFSAMMTFQDDTGALTVALSQGGDFIGGRLSKRVRDRVLRKAMNTFFCRTDKPFEFFGRINEDTNMYVTLGSRGELILSVVDAMVNQATTQKQKGGLTEIYLDSGTYVKSFYSVMYMPSAVKIGIMSTTHKRIHHVVDWERCVPKIINQQYRKQDIQEAGGSHATEVL